MYITRGYFQRGFKSLWHKSPNMDTLIAMGSAAAAIYSIWRNFYDVISLGVMEMSEAHIYDATLF